MAIDSKKLMMDFDEYVEKDIKKENIKKNQEIKRNQEIKNNREIKRNQEIRNNHEIKNIVTYHDPQQNMEMYNYSNNKIVIPDIPLKKDRWANSTSLFKKNASTLFYFLRSLPWGFILEVLFILFLIYLFIKYFTQIMTFIIGIIIIIFIFAMFI